MSRVSISSLILSPPEEPIPTFQSPPLPAMGNGPGGTPQKAGAAAPEPASTDAAAAKADAALQPPMSPPESPATPMPPREHVGTIQSRLVEAVEPATELPLVEMEDAPAVPETQTSLVEMVDPPVVPETTTENDDTLSPAADLFPPIDDAVESAVEKHIREVAVHFVRPKSKGDKRTLRYQMPTAEEYRLTASFMSSILHQSSDVYTKRMLAANQGFSTWQHIAPRPADTPSPAKSASKRPSRPLQTPRVRKKTTTTTPTMRKISTPRIKSSSQDFATPGSLRVATPHTRHREPKKPIDENWRALPDFSPQAALLDAHPRAFSEINWDGNPLDISQDANVGELHEAERRLAAALRLSCARYLTCKRRIFIARLEALKINKAFKKTDAQQACQIDVNKASKLWMAYDNLGWFHPHHYTQHLRVSS